MRRRDVLVLIGGATVFRPLAEAAQQKAMPVIGYLSGTWPGASTPWQFVNTIPQRTVQTYAFGAPHPVRSSLEAARQPKDRFHAPLAVMGQLCGVKAWKLLQVRRAPPPIRPGGITMHTP